ncbi:duplicated orphan permease [Granulicella pectinivorans]|uniref:Duplicated orphan permease n=1 Tax=Granulicella pectinivorans TaxID=474950 RepID=A0A1I6MZH4_9BACT|nr:ABC transporter permease [Granulicella pectinivorans]SFS21047.1 duplicated orphan permease [Granulicella pectinivorans]
MRLVDRMRMAWRMLFGRVSEGGRLDDELQFHLEQQVAENVAAGMSAEAARYAALRLFGNPAVMRDQTRSMWRWSSMEAMVRDVRYSVRALLRSPGFSLIAIAVMALGIGATVSLFTIVSSVLLKPLPFRDPAKLVMVYEHFLRSQGDGRNSVAPAVYRDWHAQTHGFEDMAAIRDYGYNLTGEHQELPEVVEAGAGTASLFPLLGVKPALGRTFTEDEDNPTGNHVVLLSWSLYQRRFGGDPSIVGKTIRLDTNAYTVVGVLPQGFVFPNMKAELWTPWGQTFKQDSWAQYDNHQSLVVARMKDGVSREAAMHEVEALQQRIHEAHAGRPVTEGALSVPMIEDVTREVKTPLMVLLGAVGCLLLIACLNLSNLLVARSASRRKETAIRGALGGSRMTLIRQQMMESLILCGVGGVLGVGLSLGATRWLAAHWKALPRAEAVHVDGTILAFALGLVVVSALLAGLVPAISSTGKSVMAALQDSSRSVGGGNSRATLRKTLLTAEIALTVVLLLGAGLLFKSFLHLRGADLGCTTDRVLTMKYGLPEKQYDTREKVAGFHEGLLERVQHLPGVKAAALVSRAPGDGWEGDNVFTIAEKPAPTYSLQYDALVRTVDPTYFSTLQIPLLKGRFFTAQERLTQDHFVIVSKQFAEEYFKGEDALGKHLRVSRSKEMEDFEIVGVVGDTLWSVAQPTKATMYFPMMGGGSNSSNATLVVRTDGDPMGVALPIQKQIAALDAGLPVYEILTLQQIVEKGTASQSFSASLVLAFAVLSLALAAIGLYGVLSYLVTQRVSEIGIRIALGAQRGSVLRLIMMDGLRPVLLGLLIGLAGGAAAGALIRSMLVGTSPFDPVVFGVMIVGLLGVALVASVAPALRASRIDPMTALRME